MSLAAGARVIPLTQAESLARARRMVRRKIKYNLGAGGRHPDDDSPDTERSCDCSGFIAWVLGYDRRQSPRDFPSTGGWVNTDAILADAEGPRLWFEPVELLGSVVAPGTLLVYGTTPATPNRPRIPGHVGIVTVPAAWEGVVRDLRVVHCSNRNMCRTGFAIQETTSALANFRPSGGTAGQVTRGVRFRRWVLPSA